MFPKDKFPNAMKEARQAGNKAGLNARDKKAANTSQQRLKLQKRKNRTRGLKLFQLLMLLVTVSHLKKIKRYKLEFVFFHLCLLYTFGKLI